MQDLISVIIPVYNVSDYLDKCLESIVNQTYRNLEIIIIDDGSTDNSGIICDKWANIDSRIKVYHQENSGPASARNYGLKKAVGDYLIFVDSDDYLDKEAVEFLMKNDSEDNLVCLYIKEDNKKIIKQKKIIYDNLSFIKLNIYRKLPSRSGCCGYLFKKKFIKNIFFDENLYLAEDFLFLIEYVMRIKKIKILNEIICYHYVLNEDSITRNNNYILKKIKSIENVIIKLNNVTNNLFLKDFSNKKVIMLEKEMRYVKNTNEIKKLLFNISKLKYNGINPRYLYFTYLVNHNHNNLLLIYYNIRRVLKKLLKKVG